MQRVLRISVLLAFVFVSLTGLYAQDSKVSVLENRGVNALQVEGVTVRTTEANISEASFVAISRSATKVATWVEGTRGESHPYYAISLDGKNWTEAKKTSYQLMLKAGSFDPKEASRQEFTLASRPESRLYVVQFVTQGLEDYRQALRNMGVEIHRFLPQHAVIVRMEPAMLEAVQALDFVRWVGPMHPDYKMDTAMLATRSTQSYNIVFVSPEDRSELIRQVEALGGRLSNQMKDSILIVAELTPAQVKEVAHLDTVLWMDVATEIEEDMDKARIQGGANYLESKKNSAYTGKGIRGHVLEGIYKNHPDFAATEHREIPIAVGASSPASHGQNTYGQVFGSGKGNADARGLLPDAQGLFTNYSEVYNGTPGKPGSRYDLNRRLQEEHKVMFQTASWGYGRTTEYDSRSAEMDHLIFHLDMPITQSQSNSGTRASRPQAWAKNIISVGALRHFETVNPDDDKWSRGASIGPATDGRIKPDLCAYYDSTTTTHGSTGYRPNFGGTSGATPIVAGHVGLSIEMWTDGIFGNTLKAPKSDRFGNRPHFTTTKAILICTAKQYTFQGKSHDRTRVHQGWGFPDLKQMYDSRSKLFVVNEDDVLKNLETKTYQITVAPGEPEFKATLTFAEPEATVNSTIQRINDLDLKVTDPNGTVYLGNHGLLEEMYSKSGGSADTIDTVENVFVKNPQAGTWKVEVIVSELNADNHLETSEMDIDYALVVLGANK